MDTFTLYQGRDTQRRILHEVILSKLDAMCNPLLIHRIAHIEGAASVRHIPCEAGGVESVVRHVDPVADVPLDELARLVLNGHALEQILHTVLDARFRVLVDGIAKVRSSSQRGGGVDACKQHCRTEE